MKFLFSMNGRIERKQYWTGQLAPFFVLISGLALAMAVVKGFDASPRVVQLVIMLPAFLVSLWISACLTTKRCHDLGKSGWRLFSTVVTLFFVQISMPWIVVDQRLWVVWTSVSFVTIIYAFWQMYEIGFLKGSDGSNDFGEGQRGSLSELYEETAVKYGHGDSEEGRGEKNMPVQKSQSRPVNKGALLGGTAKPSFGKRGIF
ncbi:MAG: DUF805 domain-containing protein [Rhizobiaceae bacterium]